MIQARRGPRTTDYELLYPDDFFDKGWSEYKVGFGDPSGDFWIGLDNLYNLTSLAGGDLKWNLEVCSNV